MIGVHPKDPSNEYLPEGVIKQIIYDLALFIQKIHRHNWGHWKLIPEKIALTKNFRPKVMEFRNAKEVCPLDLDKPVEEQKRDYYRMLKKDQVPKELAYL